MKGVRQADTATKSVYKRRLLIRSKEDANLIVRGIYSPSLSEWADIVEDLIAESRKRKGNRLAMFKLQLRVLLDIVDTNNAITTYKRLLENPEVAVNLIPKEEKLEKYDLDFWQKELTANRILLSALKDVGDGIAWRALNYNRPLLHTMSRNESSGPLRYNQGLVTEMNALGDIVNDIDVKEFVFHAITGFARLGDITTVRENGDVEFIEVKGKENPRGYAWKNRVNRQILRLDNLLKIANEGSGIVDGTGLVVKTLPGTPTLLLKQLRQLIQQSKHAGFAGIVPYNYLAISAVDWRKAADLNLEKLEEPLLAQIRKEDEKLLRINSLDFFEFSPHRSPMSIYPFEPDDIARILLGRIQLSYTFNHARFFKELEHHGWKVVSSAFSQTDYQPESDPFCTLNSGPWFIGMPITLAARAMFEGMSIRSIIQECEAMKANDPRNLPNATAYDFAEEHKLWN